MDVTAAFSLGPICCCGLLQSSLLLSVLGSLLLLVSPDSQVFSFLLLEVLVVLLFLLLLIPHVSLLRLESLCCQSKFTWISVSYLTQKSVNRQHRWEVTASGWTQTLRSNPTTSFIQIKRNDTARIFEFREMSECSTNITVERSTLMY